MLRRLLVPILIAISVAALVSASSRAEPLSNLSIGDVTVTEGTDPDALFTVSLDVASGVDVTFDYATSDFTAAAGDDYADTSGQGIIPAGLLSTEIWVPVHDDLLDEASETFNVTLTNIAGGDLSDDVGEATIGDDDAAPLLSIANATITEGADFETAEVSFDVTLDAPSGQTVFVDYPAADDTATQPDDYTAVPAISWYSRRARLRQPRPSSSTATRSTRSTRRSSSACRVRSKPRSMTHRPSARSRTTTGRRSRSTT